MDVLISNWNDALIIPIWNWIPIGFQFQIGKPHLSRRKIHQILQHLQFGIGFQLDSSSQIGMIKMSFQ